MLNLPGTSACFCRRRWRNRPPDGDPQLALAVGGEKPVETEKADDIGGSSDHLSTKGSILGTEPTVDRGHEITSR
jgi:hypothetical protein